MIRCWCWTTKKPVPVDHPHLLIDPVGLVEGMAQPDPEHSTEGFLDARFSREKHCLPEIVTNIWHGRDEAKRQGNKPLSQALKIIMNAFMVCSAPPPAVSSIHAGIVDHHAWSSDHAANQNVD